MLEGIPVDEALAAQLLVAPAQQLEIVLGRVLAIPVDELVLVDAGLALRAPELDRPGEQAEVVVQPVVEDAGDHFLGVVAKVVEDRDVRVAGELGALLRRSSGRSKSSAGKVVVRLVAVRAQQHAAIGMERDAAGDVRVAGDERDHGAHLRLRAGNGPGALLLVLLAPARRKVAVEVEPLLARLQL